MFFIPLGIRTRYIPTAHAASEHRLFLCRCNAPTLVVIVRQVAVLGPVAGTPVAGVVAALTFFDADKCSFTGKHRPAHIRQAGERIGGELFFLGLDCPVAGVPETHIKFPLFQIDGPLLKSLAPTVRRLT